MPSSDNIAILQIDADVPLPSIEYDTKKIISNTNNRSNASIYGSEKVYWENDWGNIKRPQEDTPESDGLDPMRKRGSKSFTVDEMHLRDGSEKPTTDGSI
jgi:hypothetical protein